MGYSKKTVTVEGDGCQTIKKLIMYNEAFYQTAIKMISENAAQALLRTSGKQDAPVGRTG